MAAKRPMRGLYTQGKYVGEEDDSHPRQDRAEQHNVSYNGIQLKMHGLCISGIYCFLFLDCCRLQIIETIGNETADEVKEKVLLYTISFCSDLI